MDARSEFLVYLGATLVTIAGLFIGQLWYASYIDVAIVHGSALEGPADPKLTKLREQEHAKLSGGAVPIAEAMRAVAARGRGAAPSLAPHPSDDLSAMSGWALKPGFKAYEPRRAPAPVAAPVAAPEGDPSAAGAVPEGAEAVPPPAAPPQRIAVGVAKPIVKRPLSAVPAAPRARAPESTTP